MHVLILGLAIFLGVHSIRIVADGWRAAMIARIGEKGWKAGYAIASLVGFVLIVRGYGIARESATLLWVSPVGVRHLTGMLTAVAFVLIAASYVPRNRIKTLVGHPMLAGVMVWAVAHLLMNGTVHAVVLFGAFFVWSLADFVVSRARDRRDGVRYPAGRLSGDIAAVAAGLVVWAVFALFLHGPLIGVRPFG
ncbi:protein NrnU [Burkholderia stabilis]|uniref:Predicted membrane protein,NnrU protein n=1 Tax=Burkholderia stabilis TaxID=95485 RepID=A0AAJ5NFT7_9BURK|nr:NnrU family protein [Burkholderia stabilis]AOR70648.1 protein NrnU [Burkholderia stabilis]VBB14650.1 Predicted membrane protein,NnrU protein [Burkholderia stabilis]HDR9492160.1 NnrU family protein [Burkholderia stabilis]HDR9522404.1 NnrU family protein [Burkholderia stabilis]HDR9530258.1 NnrU family protein [Burkholderia stabilis]